MTITNGYTSLNVYKQRFYDEGMGDTQDDKAIESVIEAVSRSIDSICSQRFWTTGSFENRYYTAEFPDYIRLHDRIISTGMTLKTDNDNDRVYETTWESTDYDLLPFNATLDGEPFRWIETAPNGNYRFPVGVAKGVFIAGKFGWPTVPKPVTEACLLMAHRLMTRRNSPYGVSGAAALGNLTLTIERMRADPDVMDLLTTYMARI